MQTICHTNETKSLQPELGAIHDGKGVLGLDLGEVCGRLEFLMSSNAELCRVAPQNDDTNLGQESNLGPADLTDLIDVDCK